MIQDIIKKLQNPNIITLDQKTLNKVDKMSDGRYASSSEAVKALITHAYVLYQNDKFKMPNPNLGTSTQVLEQPSGDKLYTYNDLSSSVRKSIKKELVELLNQNVSHKEMARKFNLEKDALAKLLKQIEHESQPPNKSFDDLTKEERKYAKKMINEHYVLGNKTKKQMLNMLGISQNSLKKLIQELENDAKSAANQPKIQKADELKKAIAEILYNTGQPSTYMITNELKIPKKTAKKLLKEMSPEGGPHIFEITSKEYRDRKIAELLKYKRLEIYSDEEIMEMLNLNERQFNEYLESFYK